LPSAIVKQFHQEGVQVNLASLAAGEEVLSLEYGIEPAWLIADFEQPLGGYQKAQNAAPPLHAAYVRWPFLDDLRHEAGHDRRR